MNHTGRGLGKIAWGYLFLYLNLNLGTLNLLPNWAAYLLFFSAIGLLEEELGELALLRPFCVLLGAAEGADWLAVLLTGQPLVEQVFLVNILVTCLSIYFNFQLLTDVAALVEARGIWAGSLRTCRNADAVLRAVWVLPLPWQAWTALALLLILVGAAVCLCMVVLLFRARKMCSEGTV